MTVLSAKVITNWYLYGQATIPAELADERLIRSPEGTIKTTQDVNAFMTVLIEDCLPALPLSPVADRTSYHHN
jgi:hypothetical protein